MSEENKTISRRLIEDAFSKGNIDILEEIVASDIVLHDPAAPPEMASGREGIKQMIVGYRSAFPDLRVTIDEQIAEGDKVSTRWSARGTHEGELMGIPPTRKESRVTGMTIDRIKDGQIAESWTNWDTLGMLQQLGVVPEMAPAQR